MKIQFKLRNGDLLDVKKTFVFRLNFDKEYLFYTTEEVNNDEATVPVIFGEIIGPSVIKLAPEERTMFETFLKALANDQVDNVSNYELITYKQLEVTILGAQKTYLPASIINKYSVDFEIVMPPKYDVISDPTPDIEPVVIGDIDNPIETREESRDDLLDDIALDVVNESKFMSSAEKEEIVPTALANRVFEQLVNSDPVDEVMNTLEPLPLELNNNQMDNVYNEIVDTEKIEKVQIPENSNKQNNKTKKRSIGQFVLMFLLLLGVFYFGYNWLNETYGASDDTPKTLASTMVCENHPTILEEYRLTSKIQGEFVDDELNKYTETKIYVFEDVDSYNTYKENMSQSEESNMAGYYVVYEYLDDSLTIYQETNIVRDEMSFDEWVNYVGTDTTYTNLVDKYNNNGYICGKEA